MRRPSYFRARVVAATYFYRAVCILSLICAQASLCYAESPGRIISIDRIAQKYEPGKEVHIVADPSGGLGIDDIVNPDAATQWSTLSSNGLNKGFTSDAYWFHFSLHNASETPREIFLEIGYPLLDQIDVYVIDAKPGGQNQEHFQAGDKLPFESRMLGHLDFVFPLRIDSGSNPDVYIRVATTSSMLVPLALWDPHDFVKNQQDEVLARGLFLGIMAVMAIYNLFLFFAVRDKSYLYYVLCLATYALAEAILTGIAYAYLWPQSVWWNDKALVVVSCVSLACISRFSKLFLNLDEDTPGIAQLFDGYYLFCLAFAGFSLLLPYTVTIRVTAILVVLIPVSAYLIGVKQWTNGLKAARWFTIAFTCFAISTVIFVLTKYGLLISTNFTEYSIHIGSVLVVCLLSLALADRINVERRDKEIAQKQAIDNLERYRGLYENSLEGIFRITPKGKPLAVNPAFVNLIGGSSVEDFIDQVDYMGDYIPGDREECQRILSIIEKQRQIVGYEVNGKKLDGNRFWGAIYARLLDNNDGHGPFIEGSVIDITDRKENELKLNYMARHDPLTDLINRSEFEHRLAHALEQSRKTNNFHALLYMDLDQFKTVNDSCGHIAGDELLRQIALLFRRNLRQRDSLARLGGDEFGVLLEQCSLEKAQEIGQLLRNDANNFRFVWENRSFPIGVSIGLVAVSASSPPVAELVDQADKACYEAKEAGRNRLSVYRQHSNDASSPISKTQLVSSINDAISSNSLTLYRQNIFSAKTKPDESEHYEVLVRMLQDGSLILPGAFMPAAERQHILPTLDCWVVDSYFSWLTTRPHDSKPPRLANINLSGQSLADNDFLTFLGSAFNGYPIDPTKICFEITETDAVANLHNMVNLIDNLKPIGVSFALDNFGSGFSSYGYLKTLAVDYVKIDGGYIREILDNNVSYAIVKSIVEIAGSLNIATIAESVETEAAGSELRKLGVDFMQGYCLNAPEPLADFCSKTPDIEKYEDPADV